MSWLGNYYDKIFWFDTETGGVNKDKNGIIQLAYIVEVCGEIQEQGEIKVNPCYREEVDEQAIAVHGITEEEYSTYPSVVSMVEQLEAVFERYTNRFRKQDKFWVGGQNVKFDMDFLFSAWQEVRGDKAGYLFSSLRGASYLDTLVLASILQQQNVIPRTIDRKLQTLTDTMGMDFSKEDAHDAIEDVKATRTLYYRLLDKINLSYKAERFNP